MASESAVGRAAAAAIISDLPAAAAAVRSQCLRHFGSLEPTRTPSTASDSESFKLQSVMIVIKS
jgi:hypothetical protein